jgi:PTS system cellobiose-specific IIA component
MLRVCSEGETIMDELNLKDTPIEVVAMNMIMHAGDARTLIMEALDDLADNKDDEALEKMEKAHEELIQAHQIQTGFIQHVASGEVEETYSVLFTHAQDTMMTIYSEYNVTNKLINIFKNRK